MSGTNSFLDKLRGGGKNFNISIYNDSKDNTDLSKIFAMQRNKDVEGLIKFWADKCQSRNFELMHPEKPIITRAVYNHQPFMTNFVFMVDENNENLWILAQCMLTIELVITSDNIYKNSYLDDLTIFPHLLRIPNIKVDELTYRDVEFGFTLSCERPYHHFYDQLKYLLSFPNNKKIASDRSFYIPRNKELSKDDDMVFLFPNVIGNNFINQSEDERIKVLNEFMEDFVFKESIERSGIAKTNNTKGLTIWFSITGQKRVWLEQVDACINIVEKLSRHFKEVNLYVDGMTAMQDREIINKEDLVVFQKIKMQLDSISNVKLVSLIGKKYKEKIAISESIDFFIANAGTGCMVPLRIAKKPGVLHSNKDLFTFPDIYPDTIKRVKDKYVIDIPIGETSASMHVSYHIPWEHVYNLTVELLKAIKGVKLNKVEVPDMESLKYDNYPALPY